MLAVKNTMIKTRVVILAVIPLITISYFAIDKIYQSKKNKDLISNYSFLTQFFEVISPLNYATLQENFYTRRYIETKVKDQRTLRDLLQDMQETRDQVDLYKEQFSNFIKTNHRLLKQNGLIDQVEVLSERYRHLPYLRHAADEKRRISPEMASLLGVKNIYVMVEYQGFSRKMLKIMRHASNAMMGNARLAQLAKSYYYLVESSIHSLNLNGLVYKNIYSPLDTWKFKELTISLTDFNIANREVKDLAPANIYTQYQKNLLNNSQYQFAVATIRRIFKGYSKGKPETHIAEPLIWDGVSIDVLNAYQATSKLVLNQFSQQGIEAQTEADHKLMVTVAIGLISIGLIVIICVVIIKSITRPLRSMVDKFQVLASSKDMSITLDESGNDELAELARAFNDLIRQFNQALCEVKAQAQALLTTSRCVDQHTSESKALATSQLTATDSVSVATTEMVSTIEEVTHHAQTTSTAVDNAHQLSMSSIEKSQYSQSMMKSLTTELGETYQVVNDLNKRAIAINGILAIIEGIAEQIDLLALNAAIEAARAGDAGRGFSVVAEEVRNLANRTQSSTMEIHQKVEGLLVGAKKASDNMKSLQNNGVEAGDSVQDSASMVKIITEKLDEILLMSQQIATAAEQQTTASNEIGQQVVRINDDCRNLTDKASQSSEHCEHLMVNGRKLNEIINTFKLSA